MICPFNCLEIGGPGPTTDALFVRQGLPHDIIRFFQKTKDHIFEICAPLYERGLSIREIEEQTGFAKTSIRETLCARGLTLRSISERQAAKTLAQATMRPPIIPYGYAWLEGRLVLDPREYKVVLEAVRLWRKGQSLTAIARHLNDKKVSTRMGKRWTHAVIGAIVKRHLEAEKQTKGE